MSIFAKTRNTLSRAFNAITYAHGLAIFKLLLVPFPHSLVVVIGEVRHFKRLADRVIKLRRVQLMVTVFVLLVAEVPFMSSPQRNILSV